MIDNKQRATLSKREIKQRRKYLTEGGYSFIIMAVQRVHGVLLKKRTVDAYLRKEVLPKTGQPRQDRYGILPLFESATNAEMEKRLRHTKELSKNLEP